MKKPGNLYVLYILDLTLQSALFLNFFFRFNIAAL